MIQITDYYVTTDTKGVKCVSPKEITGDKNVYLSDKDYKNLIYFLNDEFVDNHYIRPQACDGEGWRFEYYAPDGQLLEEYEGYTYSLKPLEKIQELLETYIPD